MLRTLALLGVLATVVVIAVRELLWMKAGWGPTLAILIAGGGLVTAAVVLRNFVADSPRRRAKLPRDPGIPRPPQGAPYRGPQ